MPAEHGKRLAALLPNSRLHTVADAFVLTMLDQPVETAEANGEFVASTY